MPRLDADPGHIKPDVEDDKGENGLLITEPEPHSGRQLSSSSSSRNKAEHATLQDVLDRVGWGPYQRRVLLVTGLFVCHWDFLMNYFWVLQSCSFISAL